MRYIKKFQDFKMVSEKTGDSYEFGCAMVYFDFPEIEEIHDMIKKDDLYIEEEDRSYGLEDEPHVTLLYGLHSKEVKDSDVIECCKNYNIGDIVLHNASLFKNEKYDVLKFDADNKNLYKINKDLSEFPNTNSYPDYHPHSTIAYLKKGKGIEYVEKLMGKEFVVNPSKIVYSKPDGEKITEKI